MAIWDCFTFFNELELLEIRLHEVYPAVDHIVLVEATLTHSGKPKPLYYQDNASRFSKYQDKIIHVVVDDLPQPKNPHATWLRENFQRNAITRGLTGIQPNDLLVVSDADEIPDVNTLLQLKPQPRTVYSFTQKLYYFYLNCSVIGQPPWQGTAATLYGDGIEPEMVRICNKSEKVADGGWHFSYLGGAERVQQKMQSFAHQEYSMYSDLKSAQNAVQTLSDVCGRNFQIRPVPLDATFPSLVLDPKFAHLVK